MRKLKPILCLALVAAICLGLFAVNGIADEPYEGNHNGSITVTVRDAITGTPLSGAYVRLEDITAGRYVDYGVKESDKKGTVSWNELSSGWYRVIETYVPDGYILESDPIVTYYDFDVVADAAVDIVNRSETALYIYRIDPETQQGLSGASYTVSDNFGATVASGTTDENGCLIIPHLEAGDYVITEVKAPNGYSLSSAPQSITIVEKSDDPFVVLFTGAEKSSITIFNYDSATGAPIAGSSWKIAKANGGTIADSLKTNTSGLVTKTDIESGTYIITETAVASGYIKELKHTTVTIGQRTENVVVSLSNTKPGNVTVFVGDSRTGEPLAGVNCYLYDARGQVAAGPKTSAKNGYVTFEEVQDGNYTVVAESPTGYILDSSTGSVTVRGGGEYNVSLTATSKGSILITAVSSSTKENLSGAIFTVRKMDGTLIGNFTTAADGTVQIPSLDNGYYVITETSAPTGYTMESTSQTVYVEAGKVINVTFPHRDRPYIMVQCYVRGSVAPVAGSVVALVNERGDTVGSATIDADGTYCFEDLDPGVYTVKFVSAPDGYEIDTPSQTVTVTRAKAGSATLYAVRHAAIVITKRDDNSGAVLPGATFIIRAADGSTVETVTTDTSGTAVTSTLKPGRYTVHELTPPDGYVPTTEYQTVEIINNTNANLTFTNKQISAVVVYAYDSDGTPMENISYILYNAITGKEVATALSNSSGIATFEGVAPGSYTVTETVVPDGYSLVNPTQSNIIVSAGEPSYVRFVHVPCSTILIKTADIETGESVGGANYLVLSEDGSFRAEYQADDNGEAVTTMLPIGTYYVKQTVAPDGYLLNTTTQTVTVYRNKTNLTKFFNKPMSHIDIECVVSGSNFGLQGVTITVEDEAAKEVARGTTLEDGLFSTGYLDPGMYTVKVISTPGNYTCIQKQRTVEVTTGLATSVKFEFTGNNRIIVNLTDASAPNKGLEGAKFRVEAENGDFSTDIVTDSSGKAITDPLPNGKYTVHEIEAPTGYILDQSYQWATVDETANTVLDFTNRRVSGLILQALTEDEYSGVPGVKFEVWHQNGKLLTTVVTDKTGTAMVDGLDPDVYTVKEVYTPNGYTARTLTQNVTINYEEPTTLNFYHTIEALFTLTKTDAVSGLPLANATFRITKEDGTFVGDYTTNKSGHITITKLDAGTYNYVETKAPDGYVRDTVSHTFTVEDGKNVTLNVTNEPITDMSIRFIDAANGDPIYGVVMEIRDRNNNYIGRYTSNNMGRVELAQILNDGRYVLSILSVPSPYIMDAVPKTIDVKIGETTTVVWSLQRERGQVTIVTMAGEDSSMMNIRKNSPLPGALYRITNASGKFVSNVVGDSNGNAYTGALSVGTYYIQQIIAPTGWQLNSTRFAVNISEDNDNVRVEVYNKAANFQNKVTVNGPGSVLAGGEAQYYFTVENDSTSAMDGFFLHIKVPTNVMRTRTFYTGTFTGSATTYYLEYRTNAKGYRTLAYGLNSKSNYSYDISSQALGLQDGEYVTDIRMVFSTVVSGFKQSMAPTLYCYVLSTVIDYTEATMRAEVGGMAGSYSDFSNGGQWGSNTGSGAVDSGWTTGSDSFTTFVQGYAQNELPDELPKTGF